MKIKIKYFNEDYPKLEKIKQGDWIDLRVDSIKCLNNKEFEEKSTFSIIEYKKGDVIKFRLGIAMELPKGYEAIIVPRSSTFRNWGLIQTNSMGVIDNLYRGNNDQWQIELIAMRDGLVERFDRICQFRIQENQPDFEFEEVEYLKDSDRDGFGSTGKK